MEPQDQVAEVQAPAVETAAEPKPKTKRYLAVVKCPEHGHLLTVSTCNATELKKALCCYPIENIVTIWKGKEIPVQCEQTLKI